MEIGGVCHNPSDYPLDCSANIVPKSMVILCNQGNNTTIHSGCMFDWHSYLQQKNDSTQAIRKKCLHYVFLTAPRDGNKNNT